MTYRQLLAATFHPFGDLSALQLDQLESHYELLVRWNRKMNLIRASGLRQLVQLHYCESLFLGTLLPRGPLRIADLGSGAGFPGVPLGVVRPESRVDLVEADQRKSVFLREATRGIPNLSVVSDRAESLPTNSYDWMVSRAVSACFILQFPLAPRFLLLSTESSEIPAKNLRWGQALKVPWGRDRVVLAGEFHVER